MGVCEEGSMNKKVFLCVDVMSFKCHCDNLECGKVWWLNVKIFEILDGKLAVLRNSVNFSKLHNFRSFMLIFWSLQHFVFFRLLKRAISGNDTILGSGIRMILEFFKGLNLTVRHNLNFMRTGKIGSNRLFVYFVRTLFWRI